MEARSYFQAHRYRMDREVEVFTGHRVDVLRRARAGSGSGSPPGRVYLDHTTVLGNNLNLFLQRGRAPLPRDFR